MKIHCPICNMELPAESVNISADTALCSTCNEAFKVSDILGTDVQEKLDPSILSNPPSGAWYTESFNGFTVGGTTRSAAAFFLVPFMCVWSGGSLGGIYGSQIIKGEFELGASLFGIPFLIGTLIFGSIAVMSVCGKVRVKVEDGMGTVFTGFGPIGWTRRFDWHDVNLITKGEIMNANSSNTQSRGVLIQGPNTQITFATMLSEKRCHFVMNALRYLHSSKRGR